MMTTPTGNKVRKTDLERLDLPDFDAQSDYSLQAVADAQGAILGRKDEGDEVTYYGLASAVTYDGTDPAAVTFGPFKFFAPAVGLGLRSPGGAALVTYERDSAVGAARSTVSLDFSAHDLSEKPFVWARRVQDEDGELPDERAFLDELTEEEFKDTTNTRLLDYVLLGISPVGTPLAKPDGSDGWVAVLRARAGSSSNVIFSARSAYNLCSPDVENTASSLTQAEANLDRNFYLGSTTGVGLPNTSEDDETFGRVGGAADAIGAIFNILGKIADGRLTLDPRTYKITNTNLGSINLEGWRSFLTDAAAQGLKQNRDNIKTRTQVAAVLSYDWDGGAGEYVLNNTRVDPSFASAVGAPVTTALGIGKKLSVTLTTLVGWEILGYDVIRRRATGFGDTVAVTHDIVGGSHYGDTVAGTVTVEYTLKLENLTLSTVGVDCAIIIYGGPI